MLKKTSLTLIICASLLTACDSPTDANEKNFKVAIQNYLDEAKYTKNAKVCLLKNPIQAIPIKEAKAGFSSIMQEEIKSGKPEEDIQSSREILEFISRKVDQDYFIFPFGKNSIEDLESLVQVGMLSAEKFRDDKILYFTTEKSRNSVYSSKNKDGIFLCSKGRYFVDKIIDFTEPQDWFGAAVTLVTYTIRAQFDDEWANSKEIQTAFKADFNSFFDSFYEISEPYRRWPENLDIKLVKTNKGWKVN